MKLLDNFTADVWLVNQEISSIQEADCLHMLSEDEKARAESFYFKKDRRYYIASRFGLRTILAKYLPYKPHEFEFQYTKFEKPLLPNQPLHFNVSHSYGQALIVVAKRPIGVDIEWSLREVELEELPQRFFSKKEVAAFEGLDHDQKQRHFFYIWTKKEAVIKAIGDGFSYPLDEFHVGITPEQDTLSFEDPEQQANLWTLKSLQMPNQEYLAALAVNGLVESIRMQHFMFD